ncbi:MAG: GNAT family N-acetyltransferase [Chloroflexia bacterium]|nr:GNAT family N-acetyltransferase [Chloroflexia bacterium]
MDDVIATERLLLPPLSADAIQSLIDGDKERLEALTGAWFPRPLAPPPLMADALPFFRDRLRDDPAIAPWWVRLIVRRDSGKAIGSAGFTGRPDVDGAVTLGYAVYPPFQNHGYATEAVRALTAWALRQPGVATIRATVPPSNAPSLRVVAKAGFHRAGETIVDDEGEVEVWEVKPATGTGTA